MALYIKPSTGQMVASPQTGYVPFNGGSVTNGIYLNGSGQQFNDSGPVTNNSASTNNNQPVYTSSGQQVSPTDPNYQAYKQQNNPVPVTNNPAPATNTVPVSNTGANNEATVNQLYNQYFGRNATPAEKTEWSNKLPALDTFLLGEFKKTTGKDYSGSPILPGETKPTEVSPADQKWVNDLYNKYFDRTATSAEINNWAKENPQALEQFLGGEQKKLGYVSKAAGAENKARYDAAMAQIDSSNLPDDIKAIWRTAVGLYPDATDFNTDEILNTFNKIKTDTIDPYYKELADVAIKDTQTLVNNSNAARQAELETQNTNAQTAVTNAQGNLESTGMTFSGQGVKQLGTGSAYAGAGANAPVQTPFAGIDPTLMAGSVGQGNRLISTSTAARYAADQRKIGSTLENQLGSGALSGITGLNYTPNGVNLTATDIVNKETKSAGTLQTLIDQWRSKQNLKTNV